MPVAGTGTPRSSWLREGAPPPVAARRGFPWAGARGSPCARGYKSAAPRQRATGRQPPAMSRGLQLLLLSCGRARDPLSPPASPPSPDCPDAGLPADTPFLRLFTPLSPSCSLQPGARSAGSEGGLFRRCGFALHRTPGSAGLLQGLLGQGKRGNACELGFGRLNWRQRESPDFGWRPYVARGRGVSSS